MPSTVLPNDSFHTSESLGLTHAEAAARLEVEGYNELPQAGRRRLLHLLFELLREPMVYLLIGLRALARRRCLGSPGASLRSNRSGRRPCTIRSTW